MKGYYLMPHPPIMVHEVGNGREAEIQKTIDSCRKIGREIESSNADTIIIITPHGTVFRDAVSLIDIEYLQGDFGRFGAEKVSFNMKINTELTREIIRKAEQENISTIGLNHVNAQKYGIHLKLDHGAMVPLYNIDNVEKYKLVHITYGMLSPMELYSFGMIIDKAVRELKVNAVLIASGDLSHRLTHEGTYPYSPHGAEFDNTLIDIINEGSISKIFSMDNTMIKEAGECGLRSLYILCGTLDGKSVSSEVLSYEGMITYYSNMAKNFGGKALVYYKNGTAVFSDNCFKEFMADDKTNKARGFYLLDHQICEPIPGWPLDSISQDIENHDKETENLLREYDVKFRKFIIDSFKLKKIEK